MTPLKRETRAEINRLLQDFTSRGGAIKRYQPGEGGWRPKRNWVRAKDRDVVGFTKVMEVER